jgi:hypothetical protein
LVPSATAPRGGVVLQGTAIDPVTGKPVTHYWTPDHLNGVCRVDVDPVTGVGTMNRSTCVLFLGGGQIKATQLSYDPKNQFIYVPDMSTASQGVWRLRYLPSADNGNGAISIIDRTLLAPGCGVGKNLPWASALGPDGNLYLGFKTTGNIVRINNPAGSTTCTSVQVIGNSADGKLAFALAFMGNDLWEADGRGLGVLPNAPACSPVSPCAGVGVFTGAPALPNALASDPVNHVLYVGDPSNVYALNLAGPAGTATLSTYATGFSFVFGLAVDPTTLAVGTPPVIYVGDDPSRGAIPGAGRIFLLPPGAPVAPGLPPPPGAPPAPVAPAAGPVAQLTPASLNFGSVTRRTTSAPLPVTLTNTGTAVLNIASITISGANAASFAIAANTCGATLAPAASCTINVTFTPQARGVLSATTLAVGDNAPASPQTVALSGTGI